MSANTGDESIFTKFTNLVSYKINNAVSDPNAEKYAAEIAKNKEEKEKEKKEKELAAQIDITANIIKASPNQFNAKRFFNKILDQTTNFLKKAFFPFIALMLAMIVANEMIVYTAPVRIIFFIFTFLVCFFAPSLCTILGVFYILKGAYSYYINNMTGKLPSEKLKIMPTIYTLLPITTYTPESSLGKFFYYPFRYPKSAISEAELPKTMDAYLNSLIESFKDFDSVKNQPIFSKQLEELEDKFKKLHEKTQINPIFKSATAKPTGTVTTGTGTSGTGTSGTAGTAGTGTPVTAPVTAPVIAPVIAPVTAPVIAPVIAPVTALAPAPVASPKSPVPKPKSFMSKLSLPKFSLPKSQKTSKADTPVADTPVADMPVTPDRNAVADALKGI
jgi:hypothetical protein